ncbi:24024_t:CDS:2, partial [Gigaspora margarita]
MVKWYETCVNQMPEKRTLMKTSHKEWLVKEINPELEVLPLHEPISLQDNTLLTIEAHYLNLFKEKDRTKAKEILYINLKRKFDELDSNFDYLEKEVSGILMKCNILLKKAQNANKKAKNELEKTNDVFNKADILEKSIKDALESAQLASANSIALKRCIEHTLSQ